MPRPQASAGLQQGRPQLWLRLAECCVGLAEQERCAEGASRAAQASGGSSCTGDVPGQGRLLHAAQCLQTALHLLSEELAELEAVAVGDGAAAPPGLQRGSSFSPACMRALVLL